MLDKIMIIKPRGELEPPDSRRLKNLNLFYITSIITMIIYILKYNFQYNEGNYNFPLISLLILFIISPYEYIKNKNVNHLAFFLYTFGCTELIILVAAGGGLAAPGLLWLSL